jgi:hypothetical protein
LCCVFYGKGKGTTEENQEEGTSTGKVKTANREMNLKKSQVSTRKNGGEKK